MRMTIRFAAAVAAFAALAAVANETTVAGRRLLTFDDFEAVKTPESLAISRDGKLVAYVLDEQIYVVPLAGGEPRAVTSAGSSAWAPYWSRDGKSLYFLSDRSESNQLWKLPIDAFGEALQVTQFPQGIDSLNSRRTSRACCSASRMPTPRHRTGRRQRTRRKTPSARTSSPASNSSGTPGTAT